MAVKISATKPFQGRGERRRGIMYVISNINQNDLSAKNFERKHQTFVLNKHDIEK